MRVKYLAIPSSIFFFLIHRRALRSQPIRGKVCRIGRIFPEHDERSFLDPEYIFVAVRRIPPTIFVEYSQLCSRTNVRPVKNGLNALPLGQTGSQCRTSQPNFTLTTVATFLSVWFRLLDCVSTVECQERRERSMAKIQLFV